MVESLQTIYKGSATIIKNKQYFSAKAYIEPFVEKMKEYTDVFMCQVKQADQISYDEKSVDYVYNRALIMAIFPDSYDITLNQDGKVITYHRVVCMTYALDVKTPICKFYTGVVDTDRNFYAFGGNCINIQKIEPETALDYSFIKNVIESGLKDNCEYILNQNLTRCIDRDKMTEYLGDWIDFSIKKEYINDGGKVKLSNNMPIEAYKALTIDKESDYYKEGNKIFYPEIMRAFISQITEDDKDIVNRYEKTQLVNNLLKL